MEQHLLTKGPLLDESGNLIEAGYAFSLVKSYSRSKIKASKYSIKEWDYYYVGNSRHAVALTIADNSYLGLASISFLDFESGPYSITKSKIIPFPLGETNLPSSSKKGDVRLKGKGFDLSFFHQGNKRVLQCSMASFNRAKESFSCDLILEETSPNSMVIATPFKKDKCFYYNQKINNQKASGYVKIGRKTYDFSHDTFGVLDWGRGVWTYKNTWYWASLNSIQDGTPIGFNLGYGFGDTKAATENMLFVGKTAYKLGEVKMDIPLKRSGKEDYLSTWKFRNADNSISLAFKPLVDRHVDSNVGIIRSNQHQVFGYFNGFIKAEGQTFEIKNLLGFSEKVFNRW